LLTAYQHISIEWFKVQGLGFKVYGLFFFLDSTSLMKLNGTVLNVMVILKDNIPGIENFRNLKSQAPRQKKGGQANVNEIPNFNIQ
jgi:hypothetical protein